LGRDGEVISYAKTKHWYGYPETKSVSTQVASVSGTTAATPFGRKPVY